MAYNKKTWVPNELVASAALNNMEKGIAELDDQTQIVFDQIAPEYQERRYAKGQFCRYGTTIYMAKQGIETPEAWNTEHWEETNIATVLNSLAALFDFMTYLDSVEKNGITQLWGAADSIPVDQMQAVIEPMQEKNGYSIPWPAEGRGNLLNAAWLEIGTGTGFRLLQLAANTTYTASSNMPSDSGLSLHVLTIDDETSDDNLVYSGHPVTFTTDSSGNVTLQWARESGDKEFTDYHWQIEAGDEATAWYPYENICPFMAYTGLRIHQSGHNLIDPENSTIGENSTTTNYIPVYEDMSVVFSATCTSLGATIYFYDANKTEIEHRMSVWRSGGNDQTQKRRFGIISDLPANTAFIRLVYSNDYEEVQLEPGTRTTEYGEYNGQEQYTYPIPSRAGIFYGGNISLDRYGNGLVESSKAMATVNGSQATEVGVASTGYPYVRLANILPGIKTDDPGLLCDTYYGTTNVPDKSKMGVLSYPGIRYVGGSVYIYDYRFTDLETARSILNNAPIHVVYNLSVPTKYDFSGAQIIPFDGYNTMWSNASSLYIRYACNMEEYIKNTTDDRFEEVESRITTLENHRPSLILNEDGSVTLEGVNW